MKTSLESKGQCVRKFPSKTQPGTINTISFAFKTSEPNRDMIFLLIQNNLIPEGDTEKVLKNFVLDLNLNTCNVVKLLKFRTSEK